MPLINRWNNRPRVRSAFLTEWAERLGGLDAGMLGGLGQGLLAETDSER